MALLTRLHRWRSARTLALAAAILALAGCMLLGDERPARRAYAFSHRVHVELELGCTDCHQAAESADEPGMPGLGACRLCHAERDAERPAEQRVEALYDGKRFRAVAAGALDDEVVFPHLKHVEAGLECADCHADVAGNDDALALAPPDMDACTACHAARQVVDDCATCHSAIRADVAPPSHDSGTWKMRHGGVCRAGSDRTADRCSLCHQDTDCAACHMTTLPQDHTNQWRRVGHGISAALDRDRCATCHRPDACLSCHAVMEPASHTGQFGSPRNRHCLGCHEPLRNEGCVACHSSTPSHALAKPKPPDHTPAMNCRQCHIPFGVQPPMPHVDNGDNCNHCHH